MVKAARKSSDSESVFGGLLRNKQTTSKINDFLGLVIKKLMII